MKTGLFLTSVCSLSAAASAWTPAASSSSSRRTFLDQAAKIVPLVVIASPAFADDEAAAAAPAAAVEGEAVVVVAEAPEPEAPAPPAVPAYDENDFVARLKAQSDANRDKYKADSQRSDKLSKRQFLSQYDRPSYVGVRNNDDANTVKMVLKAELDQLLADGKVKKSFESKVSKSSGEISDDYSKPIFVFVK